MTTKGVDISEFNGDVNFSTLKQNGISFVIIRCGYGSDYTHQDDKYFETNVQKAEAAGMPWGTYLYSYAKDADMAKSEAEHVLRLLKGRIPKYGIWYDLEDSQIANSNLTETSRAFCDRLESEGLYVGLYASLSWMENKLNNLSDYDKWVAQWNSECTYEGSYGIWQYTNSLVIGGITFDGNYSYKDYPSIIASMNSKPSDGVEDDKVDDGEITDSGDGNDVVDDGEAGTGEDGGWAVNDGELPSEEPEPEHEHKWSSEWTFDDSHHWHECLNPNCPITDNSQKDGYGSHDFDNDYDSTCNVCGFIREVKPPEHVHEWSSKWSSDDNYHWHECLAEGCDITDDSQKDGYGPHVYDDDQDTTCNTCGHVREVEPPAHEHKWDTAWSYDGQHHWHECLNPDCDITDNAEKDGYGDHVFSDDQDTTCNVCGYVREVEPPKHEHNWSTEWSSDGTCHWHECLNPGCDITDNKDKDGYGKHEYSDDQDTTCNICGYVREVEPPKHEHEWSKDWTFSETHHWHECLNDGCDITLDKDKKDYGPHVFDSDQDAECSVCGYVREIIPDPDPGEDLTEKEVQKIVNKVIEQYFSNLGAMPADDWAETALEAVIKNDIMSGDAGDLDSMRPISHTTRQEMAQVIDNALNLSATKPSNWAKKVWNKAKKAGIFDGTMPQQMITREQFAEVIVKLGLADKEE